MPSVISNGRPRLASFSDAAARSSLLSASRLARAAARRPAFEVAACMQVLGPVTTCCTVITREGRVIQYSRDACALTAKQRRTGYPAFAGYDEYTTRSSRRTETQIDNKNKREAAEAVGAL